VTGPDQGRLPTATYTHLMAMTTDIGLYEHAYLRHPRPEHGYCTDDVGRALSLVVREPEQTAELERVTEVYLHFLERAVMPDGAVHNRMDASGRWLDVAGTDDMWGRAIEGLGAAARRGHSADVRDRALSAFLIAARRRSVDVRASAFAAIGAADVLAVRPHSEPAWELLGDCLERLPRGVGEHWRWPESRLRYANATLCQALIVGGEALNDVGILKQGLTHLSVLLRLETGTYGHLSLTGTNGRGPGDRESLWDQQPIEAAAIAAACLEAVRITGDPTWASGVNLAWSWFTGENDSATALYDPTDGAGYDGLEREGRNENCGAESTLAALSTLHDIRAMSAMVL
jgi:hypothetical protein